jgi:hypothetical protein
MQTLLARGKLLTPSPLAFTDAKARVESMECVAIASIVMPVMHGNGESTVGHRDEKLR